PWELMLVSMAVPAAVPSVAQSWVPCEPSLAAKSSWLPMDTGVEVTVAPKLSGVNDSSERVSRPSTCSRRSAFRVRGREPDTRRINRVSIDHQPRRNRMIGLHPPGARGPFGDRSAASTTVYSEKRWRNHPDGGQPGRLEGYAIVPLAGC